jgi:sugar phosphate isomerase/epimerase
MKKTGIGAAALTAAAAGGSQVAAAREYGISLAGWSLHRTLGTKEGQRPMMDMPQMAREEWDIDAIELVNGMLPVVREELDVIKKYLDELMANADKHNVEILLIMIDGMGDVGSPSEEMRAKAVTNHKKWIDAAQHCGCHSIRMNWGGSKRGTEKDTAIMDEFVARSAPGFRELCEYGDDRGINVILENHWGASSYPDNVEKLIAAIDHGRFGTLPDFGNFPEDVDKYDAIDRLMVFAKAVSAKCYDFDDETGLETKLDFPRLIENVVDKHGYNGYIGIEYEGKRLDEIEGIRRAKALLEKLKA